MPTRQQGRPGEKRDRKRGPERQSAPHFEHLYGRNAIFEALYGRRRHHQLILAEGIRWDPRLQAIRSRAQSLGVQIETVPRQTLDDTAPEARHQGVLLRTSPFPYIDLGDMPLQGEPLLILDHLQDVQNFGTLLRSAEAFGVNGVIIPKDRSGEITPAVVNSSAGAVEHLRIARVTNLGRAIDQLKQSGYWIAGLDRAANAQSLDTFDPPDALALVVGAEGKGLSTGISAQCDILIRIDQIGKIDSLNASVAGSIALFHLTRRQRGRRTEMSG